MLATAIKWNFLKVNGYAAPKEWMLDAVLLNTEDNWVTRIELKLDDDGKPKLVVEVEDTATMARFMRHNFDRPVSGLVWVEQDRNDSYVVASMEADGAVVYTVVE